MFYWTIEYVNSDLERDLGDEFHFVLVCSHFEVIRKKLIKKYYWKKPNVSICTIMKCSQYPWPM